MLELPLAAYLDVIALVARCQPLLLIVLAESEWPDEVPDAFRLVTVHFDAWIEDVVLGETHLLGEAFEQVADPGVSLHAVVCCPQRSEVPDLQTGWRGEELY